MDDAGDKSHLPTPKKLDDARKKGEIPRSQEVGIAFTYLALTTTLYLFGANILTEVQLTLQSLISGDVFLPGQLPFDPRESFAKGTTVTAILAAAPLILTPLIVVMLMIAAQRSAIFVASNIAPKAERISPLSGFKKKFGANGIFEFIKSFLKLTFYSAALATLLFPLIGKISNLSRLEPRSGLIFMLEQAISLLLFATAISVLLAFVDYAWQISQHTKKNMMSFQEIKDEHRDAEGDPHFKGLRKQRALEISNNRMIHDVPNADVVIVNPTHYAVALEWKPQGKTNAPVIIAIGVDEIALRIRNIAESCGIPIHVDIQTARQLSATSSVGDEVPVELYQAVAAAIRFAQSMKPQW